MSLKPYTLYRERSPKQVVYWTYVDGQPYRVSRAMAKRDIASGKAELVPCKRVDGRWKEFKTKGKVHRKRAA